MQCLSWIFCNFTVGSRLRVPPFLLWKKLLPFSGKFLLIKETINILSLSEIGTCIIERIGPQHQRRHPPSDPPRLPHHLIPASPHSSHFTLADRPERPGQNLPYQLSKPAAAATRVSIAIIIADASPQCRDMPPACVPQPGPTSACILPS